MARRNDLTALAALGTLGYMLSKKGDKKDDKKTEGPATPVARPSMKPREIERDLLDETIKRNTSGMDVQDESGTVNKRLKRNPETGELYDTEISTPYARPATASKPTVSASKPSAPKPSKATTSSTSRDYQAEQDADNPRGSRSMVMFPGTANERGITSETRIPRFTPNEPPEQTGRRLDEEAVKTDPVDETKLSANERLRRSIERNLSGVRSGSAPTDYRPVNERFKRGGKVKKMASGGMTSSVSSASKRADGIATKGKTRGKMY